MNKLGFTLVELILTIGVMSLIGIVIVTNMSGIFSSTEEENYEAFVEKLENSACVYVEVVEGKKSSCKKSNGCKISMTELITKGYIDDNLTDPQTDEVVNDNNYYVKVSWVDGEKKCVLNG